MNTAELITQLKQDIDEVYTAGTASGYKSFWDDLTNNNNINVDCRYMFYGAYWTNEIFTPPYPIKPNPNGSYNRYMFQASGITKVSTQQMDFSEANTLRQTFAMSNVEEVEMVVDEATLNATFENLTTLTDLELTVSANTSYSGAFDGCSGLVNLTIDGTIGKAGFDLTDSTNLTLESIKSVLLACNKANANIVITLPEYCEGNTVNTQNACMGVDSDDGELINAYGEAMSNGYTISFN